MKKNNFIKGLSAIAAVGLFTACSSDYLDLAPITDVTTDELTATTDAGYLAINGIANSMQSQWGGLQDGMSGNANGESFVNQFYNEAMGADNIAGIPLVMWANEIVLGGAAWTQENYVMNYVPWKYCYTLIQQANPIINGIDNAEGEEADRQFIKAQALTFRAHGYTKLMQFYAPRWEDSRNGEAVCAVERLVGNGPDAPLWTMNEVMDQIYKDCNEAIELYKACGLEREQKWNPNINVVYGILARAAMIKHDWATAKEAAHNARQGYPVMDNDTYFSGFINDNSSIIWTQAMDPADVYYWSFGAHFAVNGGYVQNWGYGAGAISMDLYRQLDPNDVRRKMFLTPDKTKVLEDIKKAWNPGKLTEEDWWNENLGQEFAAGGITLSKGPFVRNKAIKGKWGLYNVALFYCRHYGNDIFNGNYADMNNEGFWAYYTEGKDGDVLVASGVKAKLVNIPFGAQFKFWSEPPYGVSSYPFMRAAEMCLIEAEAAYELGDAATAVSCLNEIQSKRIPGYTCSKSGEALRDEIRLCRRIELWGEGFNWSDFKRWNLPIKRSLWKPGDPTSGNWSKNFAHETPANCNGGWRMMIPRAEINYNKGIDRSRIEVNTNPNIWQKNEGEE